MATLLIALTKKKDGIKVTVIKKGNVRQAWDKRYASFEEAGSAVTLWMKEQNDELEKSAERKKQEKKVEKTEKQKTEKKPVAKKRK